MSKVTRLRVARHDATDGEDVLHLARDRSDVYYGEYVDRKKIRRNLISENLSKSGF